MSRGCGFPLPIALAQDNVLAGNPQNFTIPQNHRRLFFISLLDHTDSAPEQCQAVAFFQGSLLLLPDIVLFPQVDDAIQTTRVISS